MHADHLALVRALAETLDTASTDGLPAAPATLAAHAARTVADVAEGVEELSEAAAIMHSVADVLGAGGDVSAALCFLLARNVRSVPGLIGIPAARVVSLHGR
ncbi:MAG TPA: hypothetical protein VFG49_10660 [Dyella sp.]|uniref:hypothetical protein n=1 Tax=Dyella sp. TaxID=1869338 RepID=UPI002D786426|nr:hypothetical protein [Dyella sp.]HET6553985.1 hypothetical protein [Dyella sp.]